MDICYLFTKGQGHSGGLAGRHSVEEHLTQTGVQGLPFEGAPAAFVQYAFAGDIGFARFNDGQVGIVAGTDESAVLDAEEDGGVVAHFGDDEWEPFLKHFVVVVALTYTGVEESLHHHLQ